MISSGLMMPTYLLMLRHVYNGNKDPWLIWFTLALFFSQVFLFIWSCVLLFANKFTTMVFVSFTVSIAISWTLFNLAHFLLADKFMNMANRVPKYIKKEPPPPYTNKDKAVFYSLLTLNVLSPIAYGITLCTLLIELYVKGVNPPSWLPPC